MNYNTYKIYEAIKDTLVTGVDTNTLVAEMVFGYYRKDDRWWLDVGDYTQIILRIPEFSTNINDAMKISDICQVFALDKLRNGNWYCELRLENGKSIHHANGTVEMAICRAALRAATEKFEGEFKPPEEE